MYLSLQSDFEDFVRSRHAPLLRTATLLVSDHGHAEDLLQEALWRTHRHWNVAQESPEAYTRQTLVNLARDRHRRLFRRVREADWDETIERRAAAPADQVGHNDGLLAALALLPLRQRTALVLRFWDDMSVEDTARAMGCSAGTVKSTTSKAVAKLQALMSDTTVRDLEDHL
jgi:RNA polymerase sigma-70 factor (sigma-E family)